MAPAPPPRQNPRASISPHVPKKVACSKTYYGGVGWFYVIVSLQLQQHSVIMLCTWKDGSWMKG